MHTYYIDSIQYLTLHVLPQLFCGHWAHLLKKQRPYPAFITQLKAVIHKVNIIIMSLCDRNRVLSYTKALAFIICVGGFVWKLSDSYAAFISKDVGTKTNLKANYEENLPGLAVCRHPNQITTRWNGNISLEDKYNMTLTHLRVCDILLKVHSAFEFPVDQKSFSYILPKLVKKTSKIASFSFSKSIF